MENIKLFKPNEDEISQLSAYLWDDLNNLASGWNIKRSCESHNIVAFTIIYVSMGGKESINDILCVEKHLLHKVIDKYRYKGDGNIFEWWHNQSRDVLDHADRYQGKHPNEMLKDLLTLLERIIPEYYQQPYCTSDNVVQ